LVGLCTDSKIITPFSAAALSCSLLQEPHPEFIRYRENILLKESLGEYRQALNIYRETAGTIGPISK